MRGTLGLLQVEGDDVGIIPAHAGNTHAAANGYEPGRDHPRACGEHRMSIVSTAPLVGSSPRMRGTPGLRQLGDVVDGIIPAHAGNTRHLTATASSAGDHPRACGEHSDETGKDVTAKGSSPRMRGTLAMSW